ncbi:hypothetical protein HPP92_028316 [Vanilla planifolia]|uniref:Uncharacterized protein n=1 Tax=Vanilla planifolia TaxID=51239 RepID=A0A835P7S6_VANPL|nr:hypothetical protein HPP92_028316 [Vanilla planifolia]
MKQSTKHNQNDLPLGTLAMKLNYLSLGESFSTSERGIREKSKEEQEGRGRTAFLSEKTQTFCPNGAARADSFDVL